MQKVNVKGQLVQKRKYTNGWINRRTGGWMEAIALPDSLMQWVNTQRLPNVPQLHVSSMLLLGLPVDHFQRDTGSVFWITNAIARWQFSSEELREIWQKSCSLPCTTIWVRGSQFKVSSISAHTITSCYSQDHQRAYMSNASCWAHRLIMEVCSKPIHQRTLDKAYLIKDVTFVAISTVNHDSQANK